MLEPLDGNPRPLPTGQFEEDESIVVVDDESAPPASEPAPEIRPRALLAGRRPGSALRKAVVPTAAGGQPSQATLSPEQRLLVLDTWMKSGLPAGDFAPLVGLSKHTLYGWKARFEEAGPAGLMDKPKGGPKGSRLPELTKRAILMMKEQHPEWGIERISDMLARGPALPASAGAVSQVLHDAGYEGEAQETHPHPDKVRRFERARPNQMWQTDLFTFVLKRQNQRVYMVAYMDDNSRFIVSYALHASQSAMLVMEAMRAGITSYGTPEEVLTDNGSQYVTWRGTSQFAHECQKRGIKQIVARPRHPQTLGKVERFWGTLWRECLETAVFADLGEARLRIGHFIDHYNFQRPHQGIGGLVPADRFFEAAQEVRTTIQARVSANALDLARNGAPKEPLYLTGNVGGQPFTVHAEGERVILQRGGSRSEIDFDPRPEGAVPPAAASSPGQPVVAIPSPRAEVVGAHGLPLPVAPVGVVASGWTGAETQPAGASVIDGLVPPVTPSRPPAGMEESAPAPTHLIFGEPEPAPSHAAATGGA
jgi:transposase InsO family protein